MSPHEVDGGLDVHVLGEGLVGDFRDHAAEGREDAAVEEAIDEANIEYLDLLLDLTGDTYMRSQTISVDIP